ncbi:MAG: Hpt domain-containing protein [Candidatus Obscuribacterales bacterium]|nr:Hpt domain-containing protein [Candidatus Obscuribacterales bacterium]
MINFSNSEKCGIDFDGLQRQYGAERTLTLLRLFITENESRIGELETGIATRSVPVVSMVAHSLKGVSGMLQARKIQMLSAEIELSAKEGDWTNVQDIVRELKTELAALRCSFERYS